jgi:hypothetical protein
MAAVKTKKRKLFDELMEGVSAMRGHREGRITLRSIALNACPCPGSTRRSSAARVRGSECRARHCVPDRSQSANAGTLGAGPKQAKCSGAGAWIDDDVGGQGEGAGTSRDHPRSARGSSCGPAGAAPNATRRSSASRGLVLPDYHAYQQELVRLGGRVR